MRLCRGFCYDTSDRAKMIMLDYGLGCYSDSIGYNREYECNTEPVAIRAAQYEAIRESYFNCLVDGTWYHHERGNAIGITTEAAAYACHFVKPEI